MTNLVLAVVALAALITVVLPPRRRWCRRDTRRDPVSRRALAHVNEEYPSCYLDRTPDDVARPQR